MSLSTTDSGNDDRKRAIGRETNTILPCHHSPHSVRGTTLAWSPVDISVKPALAPPCRLPLVKHTLPVCRPVLLLTILGGKLLAHCRRVCLHMQDGKWRSTELSLSSRSHEQSPSAHMSDLTHGPGWTGLFSLSLSRRVCVYMYAYGCVVWTEVLYNTLWMMQSCMGTFARVHVCITLGRNCTYTT